MKESKNENRTKLLHVRLTAAEYELFIKQLKGTTEAKLSTYIRALILKKPLIASVRNQSLQDINHVLCQLRKDLNGIANNFNQAVKKLHTYKDSQTLETVAVQLRLDEKELLKSVSALHDYINKTNAQWLQD